MAQGRFRFFLNNFHAENQTKEILNGLQKSRNKFSPTSQIKLDKVNIYLGPKCNFEKHTFFLNSNKIANKNKIKSYLILLLNPQYFFILGKSFYSLSHIFIIEIIEDKINKIKWSYFQNLRKLKYENNEIPNSLHGSLSCVEFLRSRQNAIKYDMQRWSNV